MLIAGRATHAMVGHKNTAHWLSGELLCLVSSLGAELSPRERLNGLTRYRTAAAGWAEGGRREIFPFKNKGGKKKIKLPGCRAKRCHNTHSWRAIPILSQHQLLPAP